MKLREITRLLFIAALVLFVVPACVKEGPPGIDGADGADGTNGVDGVDGAAGADGVAFCLDCHNQTNMDGIKTEWAASLHATGSSFARGSSSSCAPCHSSEGFVAKFAGLSATGTTPVNCETCHTHGETPVFEDENGDPVFLRTVAPVNLMVDADMAVDLGGESNLCVNCHQARRVYEDIDDDQDGMAVIPGHYGPHHSPQTNMLIGIGGREFIGSVNYPESGNTSTAHATAGCTTCHMNEGAHGFSSPSFDACAQCHGTVTSYDINDKLSGIETLMEELATLLTEKGAMVDGEVAEDSLVSVEALGATWNYLFIHDDMSHGAHNPEYTRALLQNSIDQLK